MSTPARFREALASYLGARLRERELVDPERRLALEKLARFVSMQIESGETARLTFICTHNSRRSHMAQIWAQVAAHYFGVGSVESFSGGTEATAFNTRAVAALRRAGLEIAASGGGENPVYEVRFSDDAPVMKAFSKRFADEPNPEEGFAAVMTCSDADEACPFVPGAAARIAIPYVDPKVSDGSDAEAATYDERCAQIAREMLYAFSLVEK